MIRWLGITLLAILIGHGVFDEALASSIVITSIGGGKYTVDGNDMNGVAGIQLTIGYKSNSPALPIVDQGSLISGSMFTANTNTRGTISMAAIRLVPFSGRGAIATISFGINEADNPITSVYAQLIDSARKTLPVQIYVESDLVVTANNTSGTSTMVQQTTGGAVQNGNSTSNNSAAPPSAISVLGKVTMPGDTLPKSEEKPAEKSASLPKQPEGAVKDADRVTQSDERYMDPPSKPTPAPEKKNELKKILYLGILERFKAFAGTKTEEALTSLFKPPVAKEFSQEPAISVSDGTKPVKIVITSVAKNPTLILKGMTLVSDTYDQDDGRIILEVLPRKQVLEASITVVTSESESTYPLTIVREIPDNLTKGYTSKDFFNDNGAVKPKYDFDGDGQHTYKDDYIYVGHLIINRAGVILKKQ